jgi:GNAT acetyltransferase-like protein
MSDSDSELEILSTRDDDAAAWRRALDRLSKRDRDIHFTAEYARAYERSYDCQAFLAVYAKENCCILMPFALRDVRKLPFMAQSGLEGPLYDITSMYTFGGPLARLDDESASRSMYCGFQQALAAYCTKKCVVTQFTAFHPLLANHRGPNATGLVEVKRRKEVVWIDLRGDDGALLQSFARNHRRSISRARQLGVTAGPKAPDPSVRAEFKSLYRAAMQRAHASERWMLPDSYPDNFIDCLGPERFLFFNAECNGRVLASALVLRDDSTAYHHLIGSREDALPMCANHLLVYELALWAKSKGCLRLFLGGGLEPKDGIFQFKAGFSNERAWFYTANVVYDQGLYRRICGARDAWDRERGIQPRSTDFFPAYRR